MYRKQLFYVTSDGRTHTTQKKAEEHAMSQVQTYLDSRIRAINTKSVGLGLSRSDITQLVEGLVGDVATAEDLQSNLNEWLTEPEE